MKRLFGVIDTNIIISGIISSNTDSPTCIIVDGMLKGEFLFLMSVELLAEYRDVMLRPKIQALHQLTNKKIDTILETITLNGVLRDPVSPHKEIAPDRKDQHLWNLLNSEENAVLVNGDKLLLAKPPSTSHVISPQSFLSLIKFST